MRRMRVKLKVDDRSVNCMESVSEESRGCVCFRAVVNSGRILLQIHCALPFILYSTGVS